MTKTHWFNEHTKPARVGWYETRIPVITRETLMRWWDGQFWRLTSEPGSFKALYQPRQWRGLLK